tara:strand:- start:206 stop:952 length:747 start_codon:yes stop_codon:yes gene_type:complete
MTKAGLDDLFKSQKSSNCNFQNSKFIGLNMFGSVTDERFCFNGNKFIQYSNLFPNGNFGGTLNKRVRGNNYADRNKIFEYKYDGDYLHLYKCTADTNFIGDKCFGPVTRTLRAATDYIAYRNNGEIVMWDKGDREGGINLMIQSINLNPEKTKEQKDFQATTYSQAAYALMDIKNYQRAIKFSNTALSLSNRTYIQARNHGIIALSQYFSDKDSDKFCRTAGKAARLSNFEESKGWFLGTNFYKKKCL